jgi:hypothetical protein
MQPGSLAESIRIAGSLVLGVVFVIAQHVFYESSRRMHGLWRPWSEQWYGPTWREFSEMGSATFRKHEDRTAETARRRYLVMMAVTMGWVFLGLPAAFLLEAVLRRLVNSGS